MIPHKIYMQFQSGLFAWSNHRFYEGSNDLFTHISRDCFTKHFEIQQPVNLVHNTWDVIHILKHEYHRHVKYEYPWHTRAERGTNIWLVSAAHKAIVWLLYFYFPESIISMAFVQSWLIRLRLIVTYIIPIGPLIIDTPMVLEYIDRVLITHNPTQAVCRDSHNL